MSYRSRTDERGEELIDCQVGLLTFGSLLNPLEAEIWLRDPDGYTVVLASPDGTADGNWRPGP